MQGDIGLDSLNTLPNKKKDLYMYLTLSFLENSCKNAHFEGI